MANVLMPKATAAWLIDNTALTFEQIGKFCSIHPLEIKCIADGEGASSVIGLNPIVSGQLTQDEIDRCSADPNAILQLADNVRRDLTVKKKKKVRRYTPIVKRLERVDAIAWVLRNHPELSDSQICDLLGTTKVTVNSVRDRSHWNSQNIKPIDPVKLGLCRQLEFDDAVAKAKSSI